MAPPQAVRRPLERPATYQDVLDAPGHKVADVVEGALYTHPRPAMPHALASSSLGDELSSPFQKGCGGPGGWRTIDEPELHLGEDILMPDLAGWRRERMPDFPDTAFVTLAPDWVCEVLSRSTRDLESFELRDGEWVLIATARNEDPDSIPPFEAISFPLDALWP